MTVAVSVTGAQPSRHVFHVTVLSPAGKALSAYTQNVLTETGTASVTIPWALNETSGGYTVEVRDAMSGVLNSSTITITP
jgi:hypothetical protein